LFFAMVMLIAVSILLYRIRPLAGITFGSSAIALVVLAHLGVLAAIAGPVVAWRRRRRPPQPNRRK
jgi:membrane protein implicated in regulation of membrane protease activity